MFGTLLCAAPALQLKAWESLQTKTAAAAAGYTLRDGLVPSSAPQATIPPLRGSRLKSTERFEEYWGSEFFSYYLM